MLLSADPSHYSKLFCTSLFIADVVISFNLRLITRICEFERHKKPHPERTIDSEYHKVGEECEAHSSTFFHLFRG